MADPRQLLTEMDRTGLVPVFFHPDFTVAREVLRACHAGGVRVFEFTNRGDNAFDVFAKLVPFAATLPGLSLGIGTILNAPDAVRFINAGAAFVVSPILDVEMGEACRHRHTPWIPGTGTLTEVVTAHRAGASVIKIFPGSVLGPKFIEAVLPVVPGLRLMPTGGVSVNEDNLKAWFGVGAFCVGVGSTLFSADLIQSADWQALTAQVKTALATAQKVRTREK